MKNLKDLSSLSISEYLESILGEQKAKDLMNAIQNEINKNVRGEDLSKFIEGEMKRQNITQPAAQEILMSFPQVIIRM